MADTQFVVFKLADELYGAEILSIQEIVLPQKPTKVPNNPDFIEGVINYRDEVVPVLDLKKRFHLGESDYEGESRFIVAECLEKRVAFVVDEVAEILRVEEDQVGEAPEMTRIQKEYITGVARIDDRLIVLLDLSKVLTVGERDIIDGINNEKVG